MILQRYSKVLHTSIRSCSKFRNINDIFRGASPNDTVNIKGWIKNLRKMKEITFFDVSDGSSSNNLQVLVDNKIKPSNITTGASVNVNGNLSITPKGQLEVNATNVEVIGESGLNVEYPFAPRKTYSADYVRQYLHLRNRTNKFQSLLRVRDSAFMAIHEYLHENGYVNVHTPILTSNDCEGAGEVFTVIPEDKNVLKNMMKENFSLEEAYFDNKVFLTVSGQLHLEAVAHGIKKVYTMGPTFRAENSRSRLHLSEFYMLESEIAFLDNLEELLAEIENLVKQVTERVLQKSNEDVRKAQDMEVDLSWTKKTFPVLTYSEAIDILKAKNGNFNPLNGFTKEDEIFLVDHCGGIPTFIINWPKIGKPFYMKECKSDPNKVAALDLLGPKVGEVVGGSLRENNYEKLKNKLSSDCLNWYIDLRKYGSVPTGGFGLGFERYLQLILGINNIKDTIPFPRWPHNCKL